jgi:hypothetical protein
MPLDDAKGMRFGHVMHSLGSGGAATKLSVTDKADGYTRRLSPWCLAGFDLCQEWRDICDDHDAGTPDMFEMASA